MVSLVKLLVRELDIYCFESLVFVKFPLPKTSAMSARNKWKALINKHQSMINAQAPQPVNQDVKRDVNQDVLTKPAMSPQSTRNMWETLINKHQPTFNQEKPIFKSRSRSSSSSIRGKNTFHYIFISLQ